MIHIGVESPFDITGHRKHDWSCTDWELTDVEYKERVKVPPPINGNSNTLEFWFNTKLDFITAILTKTHLSKDPPSGSKDGGLRSC